MATTYIQISKWRQWVMIQQRMGGQAKEQWITYLQRKEGRKTMAFYYTVSCFAGNYRTRTDTKHNAVKPKAFARGIFRSRKIAERHAQTLAEHFGQIDDNANVLYFVLPCDVAERRYSLSV